MEVLTTLIISAVALGVLFLILLLVWAMMPPKREHKTRGPDENRAEMRHIKDEIEHESMEELMPYKPASLGRPSKKRL